MEILFSFNAKEEFQVVIVDNSNDDHEFELLNKIAKKYNKVVLIKNFVPKDHGPSIQHGRGLDIAMDFAKYSNSSYFLTLDPDCFLLRKNYLSFMTYLFEQGNIFVGTEYSEEKKKKITEHSEFPCAFACGYNLKEIGYDTSFLPISKNTIDIDKTGKDVGYKFREKFHSVKYLPFKQKKINSSIFLSGKLFKKSFEYYFFEDELVAIHFNKTSRKIKVKFATSLVKLYWNFIRGRNAKLCFEYIKNYDEQ